MQHPRRQQSSYSFPEVQVSHRNSIQNLVNKVRTTGILTDWKLIINILVLTEENLDDIRAWLENFPCKSL
jgi:hypothetical protein